MKMIDVVQLTRDAIANTLGADYFPESSGSNKDLKALQSFNLVDAGEKVLSENTISNFVTGLMSLMGRHILDNRLYNRRYNTLFVESFDWGGYLERTRIGLGEIMSDPMYDLSNGKDYSAIEHTFYGADVHSKIYGEGKAIMTPISICRDQLRDAFRSWEDMDIYLSGIETQIKNTINIALDVYSKMLFQCAIATSDKKNNSAVHLISEAVANGILKQVNDGTETGPNLRNPKWEEVFNNKDFLAYCSSRIKMVRSYMLEPSEAFNDGTIPTWCDRDPNLALLEQFVEDTNYYLRADTYNPDSIKIGEFDTVTCWQGIRESSTKDFDRESISKIMIANDPSNKLGIGTDAYTKSGVVGLMFDYKAIGMTLNRNKVTSSYTACADFWNQFHHSLVNYILDSSYAIVAFIMD